MRYSDLPKVTPESLGISSKRVLKFIDDLEQSGSELHGVVMLRHGKKFAEGWWQPYAKGVVHASQSLTKTMTGAAYGAAEKLGILDYNELIIDIFPEFAALTSGPYWNELKLYHLLTMSSGMEKQHPVKSVDWLPGFFRIPIVNKPGTKMYYNSSACSVVGASIRKRSGKSLHEFLSENVFDKIGIDSSRIKWLCHPDGQENGSGGILSTTEDNARLIQLFLQNGEWNGRQVISRRWAKMAVQLQNNQIEKVDSASTVRGYGGMMWIRNNSFYADGAMGQLAAGFPEKDMVISLNQTAYSPEGIKNVSEILFSFDDFVQDKPLPENPQTYQKLENRLKRLSLPAPVFSHTHGKLPTNIKFHIIEGEMPLFAEDNHNFAECYREKIYAFEFFTNSQNITLRLYSESGINNLQSSLDGRRWYNYVKSNNPAKELSLSTYWKDENTLFFEFRWLENCRIRFAEFRFSENSIEIVTKQMIVGGFDEGPWYARAEKMS